jgi:hypothetical protein
MHDNDGSAPMQPEDYVIDESFLRTKNNSLLSRDGIGANSDLTDRGEKALAALAEAVHKHARYLSPEQTELAVRWLKRWKLWDAVPADYDEIRASEAFAATLKALRESPEQVQLQSVAARHGTWSRLWAAVFAASLATMVGMGIIGGAGTVAWLATAAALLGSLIASERSLVRALVVAKEQDRKYALESLRAATTVRELLNAGLWTYLPGVGSGIDYDNKHGKSQIFKDRERLADALYLDPDGLLDPYGFRDNGPRV